MPKNSLKNIMISYIPTAPNTRIPGKLLIFFFIAVLVSISTPLSVHASPHSGRYDILYVWTTNIDNLLDYMEEIEELLGPKVSKKLKVINREKQYGLIYDRDGSALTSTRLAIRHSEKLRKAGLDEAAPIKDENYYELYNVSYGLGKNLNDLKRQYEVIYNYLGAEVGKSLFIEKTDSGNYTLIYQRRGDNNSTSKVARRHAKILQRKGISASITLESNNEIVHGESSHLDGREEKSTPAALTQLKVKAQANKTIEAVQKKPKAIKPHGSIKQTAKTNYKRDYSLAVSHESNLEKRLETFITSLRNKGQLASDERTGWLVYDLTSGKSLVDINVRNSLQAASMIKPFVALAFFHQTKHKKLIYGPKSRKKMTAMIQRSSNSATNWVMKQVGGPKKVHQILKTNYGHIFTDTRIVEYIPSGGRTYRNQASPDDYGRFLRNLWHKKLPRGKEIRRLMALPGRDRLYSGTPIPQGTLVYNKTGSTAHLCGDMGILAPLGKDGRRYPYIIVGIIEKKNRPSSYGRWKIGRSNMIRQVSSMVYKEMKQNYNLL